MDVKTILFVLELTFSSWALPVEESKEAVEPEYLDTLLTEGRYEEFNRLMGIELHHLSLPREQNNSRDPRYNHELLQGDILLTSSQVEQVRQGVLFSKYSTMKWSYVPYVISSQYNSTHRQQINRAAQQFSSDGNQCIQWRPRISERDYVFIYPGDGCFSHLGKTGGQQPLSLASNGCMSQGTMLHEFNHAIGFMHEQCRPDRDNSIRVLTGNIKQEWQSQYDKTSSDDYGIQGAYDYYSIMHYPQKHPDVSNNLPAFEVLASGIDVNRIGYGQVFTDIDKQKIRKVYC